LVRIKGWGWFRVRIGLFMVADVVRVGVAVGLAWGLVLSTVRIGLKGNSVGVGVR